MDYQVFYDRDATNHPGGDDTPANVANSSRSPNWFHYWSQVVAANGVVYWNSASPDPAGCVPAMLLWSPNLQYGKTDIWIAGGALGSYVRRDGSNQQVSGIDQFANVVAHEGQHVTQIHDADALLQNVGQAGPWLSGWSWNAAQNNHYTVDAQGNVTQLDANANDWPDSWEAEMTGIPSYAEEDAQSHENVPENTYWQQDWGSPGKQHATDQLWTD